MKTHPVYLKACRGEHIHDADLASLIRSALKREFPGSRISVRVGRGCAIYVQWTDGPTTRAVERVACAYQTSGFDGSIDLAYTSKLWLAPDGSACTASSEGTQGSGGYVPEHIEDPHDPDAVLVSSVSSPFVMCQRDTSAGFIARAASELLARYGRTGQADPVAVASLYERGALWSVAAPWQACCSHNLNWQAALGSYINRLSEDASPVEIH